jgi:hypothetical protein
MTTVWLSSGVEAGQRKACPSAVCAVTKYSKSSVAAGSFAVTIHGVFT